MSNQPERNVFDAAKAVVESLQGLEKQLQIQALRFASESLGLDSFVRPAAESTQQQGSKSAHAGGIQPVDLRQFVASKLPQTDQQFAAVVAYYYQFIAPESLRKPSIDLDDLKEASRLAGPRPIPSRHVLNNAKKAGYIDPAGRGKFRINTVGENLVTLTLGTEASGAIPRAPRRQSKNATPAKKKSQKRSRRRK